MLHDNIRNLREEYDISQERLGKYMKVTIQQIQNWEDGDDEPSLEQIKKLANLFQLSIEDMLKDNEVTKKSRRNSKAKIKSKQDNKPKAKRKKKTKKKIKHKTETKYKTNQQKIVKKRRSWPIIFFIIILLAGLAAGGGYLYWKYGDEYFIGKKNDYKVSNLAGTFTDENAYNGMSSSLVLKSDKRFTFMTNTCKAMDDDQGTWMIKDDEVILNANSGATYKFKINSMNQLRYTSETISCGPYKQDIFTRGAAVNQNDNKDKIDKEESNIKEGSWSGSQSTLQVTSKNDSSITFSLTCSDIAENVASISNIEGTINGDTVNFTFKDDGYGNAGTGTLTFGKDNVKFKIQKTTTNPDAVWSIKDSGTLYS